MAKIELIRKGAEAYLYKTYMLGIPVIIKHRISKEYRDKVLDYRIRYHRTILEAKIIGTLRLRGLPVPAVLLVDPAKAILVLEYIEGTMLKELISRDIELSKRIFMELGKYIGIMHSESIVHGDLTTSNVIVRQSDNKPFIIDFGLAHYSNDIEDQGVDIHLMLRSLESTHPKHVDVLFKEFLKGYTSVRGEEYTRKLLDKVKEIRMRGRYVEERRLKKI